LSFGFRVLHEVNTVAAILPTIIVGTVLLLHRRRGLRFSVLLDEVAWLRREVSLRGGRLGDSTASLNESVGVVVDRIMVGSARNRLIKRHKDIIITGLFTPIERMELSTFRNSLIHLFVVESMVATAHHRLARESPDQPVQVADMLEDCTFLSSLLKLEFIFGPTTLSAQAALQANFFKALESLSSRGVLIVDDGVVQLGEDSEAQRLYRFLTALLWPFIDSYFITAVTAFALLSRSGSMVTQGALVNASQQVGEKMFFDEQVEHYEAIAKDTLQNAVAALLESGELQTQLVQGGEKLLTSETPEKLRAKIESINSFRGDGPRDTCAAVSFALAEAKVE
jgi:glycerol-3-phosphate O-acyltransferase